MKLTLSIAQIKVTRGDPQANLAIAETLIAKAAGNGSELICFPEMWTTGFDWAANARLAQDQEPTIAAVSEFARRYKIWINGSMLALNDDGKVANTSILFDADGRQAAVYCKSHLFSFMHENLHMAPGNSLATAKTPWGLIGLSVCYDIRFPELFRTYALKGVKMVLSPMAFPNPRLPHWKALVRARAIENQMFMVGTNQVGDEDFGPDGTVTYFGDSCVVDPWGETALEASETAEELLTATVDMSLVDQIRAKMHVLSDRRPDLYELE